MERLILPSLVGELIAGIGLGVILIGFPDWFPTLSEISDNVVFAAITDLGMFFLMLYAGIELNPRKIVARTTASFTIATGGMILPLGLGVLLGLAFIPESPLRFAQCLFLGTALAITAVPATVRILTDLGQLDTRLGETVVSAAVFDDVLSLILLAWLTGVLEAGVMPNIGELVVLSGYIVLFFVVTVFVGVVVFPWGGRLMVHFKVHEIEMSAMLIGAFAFSVLAELLHLHFIVGAFVAGLFFNPDTIDEESYERLEQTVSAITVGFLGPIFFASIGLEIDFSSVLDAPLFLTLLILSAFLGKILGAGIAARVSGFSSVDSGRIGVAMSPRGAVELVIAGIALKAGLFATGGGVVTNLFSSVVVMAVVTTLISPILLSRMFRSRSG
jgi:Kef-type K+ transport system membrane component KefB